MTNKSAPAPEQEREPVDAGEPEIVTDDDPENAAAAPEGESADDEIEDDDEPEDSPEEELDTGDEPDGDETEGDEDGDPGSDAAAPKKRNNIPASERIGQLTKRLRVAERELETVKRQQIAAAAAQEAPKPENFEDHDDYLVQKALYESDKRQASRQAELDAVAEQQKHEEAWAGYVEYAEVAREKHEDFDEVTSPKTLPISDAMLVCVVEAEAAGPEVLYWLGKNPREAKRISQLPPHKQSMEIGRVLERLTAPKPQRSSQAPSPVRRLKGGDVPRKSVEKMTQAQYEAGRAKGEIR
jgi:hypothetical protein